jgi:hypothetical protein
MPTNIFEIQCDWSNGTAETKIRLLYNVINKALKGRKSVIYEAKG